MATGSYSWRARATDGSAASGWTEFGGSATGVDFLIGLSSPPALPSNPAQLRLDGSTFLAQGATAGDSLCALDADGTQASGLSRSPAVVGQ